MFDSLVAHMGEAAAVSRSVAYEKDAEVPAWAR
jgi:hypothetical protein